MFRPLSMVIALKSDCSYQGFRLFVDGFNLRRTEQKKQAQAIAALL